MKTRRGDDADALDRAYTRPDVAESVTAWALTFAGAHSPARAAAVRVLEPSTGGGAFVLAALRCGVRNLVALDVDPTAAGVNMARALGLRGEVCDVLAADPVPVDLVVGNPPFAIADDFVRYGLRCAPLVVYLLPGTFAAGSKRHASGLLGHLAARVTIAERIGFSGPGGKDGGSPMFISEVYAFRRDVTGPAVTGTISVGERRGECTTPALGFDRRVWGFDPIVPLRVARRRKTVV